MHFGGEDDAPSTLSGLFSGHDSNSVVVLFWAATLRQFSDQVAAQPWIVGTQSLWGEVRPQTVQTRLECFCLTLSERCAQLS
jgi:hypothetical protein